MVTKAMILASGRGERMMPLTRDLPKPMLKIGNVTLIEDKIIKLSEIGIQEIVINTGYLGEYIRDHVGDGSKFGIRITLSDEGDQPIGTAEGVRKVLDYFESENFILVNADIWTNYSFIDLKRYQLKDSLGHIILTKKPDYQNGDFNLSNNLLETGNAFTFTGIGLYSPELFVKYKDKDLGVILKKEKSITADVYSGMWDDIGTPERLKNARDEISM